MRNWPHGMAKSDEDKHDKVTFELAAVDLNSYGLKSLWQTSYLNR